MKKNMKTLIYATAVAAGLISVTGSPIKLDSMDVVHAEEVYRVDDPLSGDLAPLPEEHAYWAVSYDLDANGGVCSTNYYVVTEEEPNVTLPIPTRDGYEFDGWYDEKGNKVTEANADTGKLTARWAEMTTAKSWAVVYPLDANGGVCKESDYIVTMEEPNVTLPIPTRDGYEFDGWYDEKGNKVTEGNPGTGPLTAHWTELPTAKSWAVAYDLNANGGVCDQKFYTVTQEEPTTTLPTPTRDGYEFNGWYDTDGHKITVANSTTGVLTARWIKLIKVSEGVPTTDKTAVISQTVTVSKKDTDANTKTVSKTTDPVVTPVPEVKKTTVNITPETVTTSKETVSDNTKKTISKTKKKSKKTISKTKKKTKKTVSKTKKKTKKTVSKTKKKTNKKTKKTVATKVKKKTKTKSKKS